MKMMIHHVTGSMRGRTQYFDADSITFGVAGTCSVVFDPSKDPIVAPLHAQVSVERHIPILHDRSGHNAVQVNGQPATEKALHDGDLIQFGEQGPLMRFHVLPDGSRGVKPWRDIVIDSQDIVVHTPHRRYTSPLYLARAIFSDVIHHGSTTVKLVAAMILLVPLLIIAALTVRLYQQYAAVGQSEERIAALLGELETGRLTHAELERRVEDQRREVEALQGEREELIATLRATVEQEEAARLSESELQALRARLEELETSQRFAEDIIGRFEKGVGLLQGGYRFLDPDSQQPLRYLGFDEAGRPLIDERGNLRLTLEGDTPPLTIYYAGTGFLVDAGGTIVTNRHLVRMWETYPAVQAALEAGYRPEVSSLRIFFPGDAEPFNLEVLGISDRVDLALLRTDRPPRNVPIIPLASPTRPIRLGEPVIILSYPGTFDSLLSRLPAQVSGDVLRVAGSDPMRLAEVLAQRQLVRPLSTHGHVSDASALVVTYEARSAGGSSGGPVLDRGGQVIAVNHAMIQRVTGVNLGSPVSFVHEMLTQSAAGQRRG